MADPVQILFSGSIAAALIGFGVNLQKIRDQGQKIECLEADIAEMRNSLTSVAEIKQSVINLSERFDDFKIDIKDDLKEIKDLMKPHISISNIK